MATIIYPQRNTALQDILSMVEAGTGIAGLLQRKKMDAQSRGLNVDDTEITNPDYIENKKYIDSQIGNAPIAPVNNLSSIQQTISQKNPDQLAGEARYRALDTVARGNISDANFNKIYDPSTPVNEVQKLNAIKTPQAGIAEKAQLNYNQGQDVKTGTGPIIGFNNTYNSQIKQSYDPTTEKYVRDVNAMPEKAKAYEDKKKEWSTAINQNPEKFTGNAFELKRKIQDSANILIDKHLKDYWADPLNNIKSRSEAVRLYDRSIKSLQNVDKMHGWNVPYASTNEWLADKIKNPRVGSGSKMEQYKIGLLTENVPSSISSKGDNEVINYIYDSQKTRYKLENGTTNGFPEKGKWVKARKDEHPEGILNVTKIANPTIGGIGSENIDIKVGQELKKEQQVQNDWAYNWIKKNKSDYNPFNSEGQTKLGKNGKVIEDNRIKNTDMAIERIKQNGGQVYETPDGLLTDRDVSKEVSIDGTGNTYIVRNGRKIYPK